MAAGGLATYQFAFRIEKLRNWKQGGFRSCAAVLASRLVSKPAREGREAAPAGAGSRTPHRGRAGRAWPWRMENAVSRGFLGSPATRSSDTCYDRRSDGAFVGDVFTCWAMATSGGAANRTFSAPAAPPACAASAGPRQPPSISRLRWPVQ